MVVLGADTLRKPLLFFALALIALIVVLEMGSGLILDSGGNAATVGVSPPGFGIPSLALLDSLVLFTTLLISTPFLLSHRLQGRIQGVATFVVSLLLLLWAIALLISGFVSLVLMVTLLLAPIFGTIAYFALYGTFDTSGAALLLSLIMLLKLMFAGCLVFAHQRFLQNTGLVLIILTTLLGTWLISLLHALVPGFLVSITDAIAGIVIVVFAILWLLFFLIGSLIAIVKAIL